MAIEVVSKKFDNVIRAEFPNAYLKIHDVEVRMSTNEVWIRVLVYANKDARSSEGVCSIAKINEKVLISNMNISSFTKDGILAASYAYLKTLPKYAGLDV